jgi:hypothetical protein
MATFTFNSIAGANSPMDVQYTADELSAPDTWAKEREATTADTNDAATGTTRDVAAGLVGASDWSVSRVMLNFATGTILNGATIISATLAVYVTAKRDQATAQSYIGVGHFTGSSSSVTNGDFDQLDGLNQSTNTTAITKQANDLDIGTDITTSAFNTWTLNATGLANINQIAGGITGFALVTGADIENVAQNSDYDAITVNMTDVGSNIPVLTVVANVANAIMIGHFA